MNRFKTWWRGEPMIYGGLRWRIVENDLLNEIRKCLAEWRKVCKK